MRRWFLTVFLSLFVAVGLFTLWHLSISSWRMLRSYGWDERRCVVETSEAVDSGDSDSRYRFEVRYRYEVGGTEYEAERYRMGYDGSDAVNEAERLAARFAPGEEVPCRVNPEDPTDAALLSPHPTQFLWLLFPFAFGGIPGAVLYFLWRRARGARAEEKAPPAKSISQRVRGKFSKLAGAAFFAVFLLFGLGFGVPFVGVPLWKVVKAQGWTQVPCEILESGVQAHQGDDSTTYSIEVVYRYELDGRKYRGDRYQFMGGSSSGYRGKQAVVERMPPGATVTCWVDPDDPFESVVHRGLTLVFLVGLLPLVFVLIGGSGVAYCVGSWWEERTSERSVGPGGFRELKTRRPASPEEPVVLEARMGPFGKFVAILGISLFWNGIVGVFVWQLVSQWRETGHLDGCLTVFLVPFFLVGILFLISVPYQLLALVNPRPRLRLGRASVPLGGEAELGWSFRGPSRRLEKLEIYLEGAESARYTRGTDTRTDRRVFARIPVVERSGGNLKEGNVTIRIPADTMHSWDGGNNKVEWVLKLAGSIRRWPDVLDEFTVKVVPGTGGGR